MRRANRVALDRLVGRASGIGEFHFFNTRFAQGRREGGRGLERVRKYGKVVGILSVVKILY